jgi:hypothetical protein
MGGGRRRHGHGGLPHLGRLRGRRPHGQQDREHTGTRVMVSNANQETLHICHPMCQPVSTFEIRSWSDILAQHDLLGKTGHFS